MLKPEYEDISEEEFVKISFQKLDTNILTRYKINKLGRILDLETNKILKVTNKEDYPVVTLRYNGKTYSEKIHLIIANTFLIKERSDLEVDHIDRDPNNYSLSNLRFVTRSENKKNRVFSSDSYSYYKLWIGFSDKEYTQDEIIIYEKYLDKDNIRYYNKSWKLKSTYNDLYWKPFHTNEDDLFNRFNFPKDWKLIPSSNNSYCSSTGLILLTGKPGINLITTGYTNKAGYKLVNINKSLKRVHRLVYELFGNNLEFSDDKIIDHIDTNRLNNNITNLRLVNNQKENLSNENTIKNLGKTINQYDLNGVFINSFNSIKEALISINKYNPQNSRLSSACSGHQITAYGFLWCYEGEEDTIPTKVEKLKNSKSKHKKKI